MWRSAMNCIGCPHSSPRPNPSQRRGGHGRDSPPRHQDTKSRTSEALCVFVSWWQEGRFLSALLLSSPVLPSSLPGYDHHPRRVRAGLDERAMLEEMDGAEPGGPETPLDLLRIVAPFLVNFDELLAGVARFRLLPERQREARNPCLI